MFVVKDNSFESHTVQLLSSKKSISNDIGAAAFLELIYSLSIIFASLAVTMIIYMLINRIIQNRKKNRDAGLRLKYQEYLADFISIPMQDELQSIGISTTLKGLSRADISKNTNRTILLEELYGLHQQLNGYQAEMLKHLFWGWSMHEDAIIGLQKRSPHTVTRSIDLIMEFGITGQLEVIRKLVSSKHSDVRSQAMACIITLTEGDLMFLKNVNLNLTDWEKHKILFAIQNIDGRENINFDHLVKELPFHELFVEEIRQAVKPQLHHYLQWVEEIS